MGLTRKILCLMFEVLTIVGFLTVAGAVGGCERGAITLFEAIKISIFGFIQILVSGKLALTLYKETED